MRPAKEQGFMRYDRETPSEASVEERLGHWGEFSEQLDDEKLRDQSYRCMNCGVPFCHDGCPLGNVIPDFNDAVKDDRWEEALEILHSTNNFPEFTGRVCPAPCEASCVLAINEPAVSIKVIEQSICDRGWRENWIGPEPPENRTGFRVAVVGSGPAGLAAAQQLNRAGHLVTVYERDDEAGGLLLYGIPDFKLDKESVRRRVGQMEAEGVLFECNSWVGRDLPAQGLVDEFDAVLLTIGSTKGRKLGVPGEDLDGVHMAMEFLAQQNRRVSGKEAWGNDIVATGKNVVVLGGGDTGSDCLGTSIRQGAKRVWNFELLPKPPGGRNSLTPWPEWPLILRTSSSHREGGERDWSVLTKSFSGENGKVSKLHAVRLEWTSPDEGGRPEMREVRGSEFEIDCDLVLLALGFLHPEGEISVELGLELDGRGNILAEYGLYRTSHEKVFAAGDARRGQSLVVWAIHEGREAARCIDVFLVGRSDLAGRDTYGYEIVSM